MKWAIIKTDVDTSPLYVVRCDGEEEITRSFVDAVGFIAAGLYKVCASDGRVATLSEISYVISLIDHVASVGAVERSFEIDSDSYEDEFGKFGEEVNDGRE